MNQNCWHRTECLPGACRFNNPQCPECGSCFSPMNVPGKGHDDGCTRGQAELAWFRERLAQRSKKPTHVKLPAGGAIPIPDS